MQTLLNVINLLHSVSAIWVAVPVRHRPNSVADETFPEIFPAEVIHFRKPSVKEWKGYMDFLVKKFGSDDIKDFIKKYEGKKEWGEYVKSAVEKNQEP